MSNNLNNFRITSKPAKGLHRDASHLRNGNQVAITETGLRNYNRRRVIKRMGSLAAIGLITLPISIGGGIGVAAMGEAVGIGFLEQAAFGAAVGAGAGKISYRPRRGYLRDDKHKTLAFVDMIGTIVAIQPAWFSEYKDAKDVQVKWVGTDEYGNRTTFTAWHDPSQLFRVEQK